MTRYDFDPVMPKPPSPPYRTLPTLTEFLLARIAEDEEVALSAIRQRDDEITKGVYVAGSEPQPDADQPVVWDDWTGGPGIRMGAERLRGECEAKRRIVEEWQRWHSEANAWHGRYRITGQIHMLEDAQRYDSLASTVEKCALRHLAAIYSDHPDYRPEWKR